MAASTPDYLMARFTEFIPSLIADAQSILEDKLLYSKPTIELKQLTDDFREHLLSFVERQSNSVQLSTRITDIASNYREKSGASWASPNKTLYRKNIDKFLELMLLLFLFTGGHPDQGPEIFARDTTQEMRAELISLSHTARPLEKSLIITRNFFIDMGRVCIITADHHHETGLRGRVLPDQISQMLVLYLACVLPFQQTLDPSDPYSTSEHLFADKAGTWHTTRFIHVLKRETRARMGVEMNLETANALVWRIKDVLNQPEIRRDSPKHPCPKTKVWFLLSLYKLWR